MAPKNAKAQKAVAKLRNKDYTKEGAKAWLRENGYSTSRISQLLKDYDKIPKNDGEEGSGSDAPNPTSSTTKKDIQEPNATSTASSSKGTKGQACCCTDYTNVIIKLSNVSQVCA